MRKIFITIVTALFFFMNNAEAQLTVSVSSVEVDQNAQATVNVTVNGFTSLVGVQFSLNYDSLLLDYVSAGNFSTTLPNLSSLAVSGPNGVGVKKGQITFSWFDSQGTGKTLANGGTLFSIVFATKGAKGSKADVSVTSIPRKAEFYGLDLIEKAVTGVKGTITIKGDAPPPTGCTSPVCANAANLTFVGGTVTTEKDKTICVPITVRNFNAIQSGQGSIRWKSSELQFIEVKIPSTGGLPTLAGSLNTANAPNGSIIYIWSNPEPAVPLTLANNTVIMELCFKVLANAGTTSCIEVGQGSLITEWSKDSGEVPVCNVFGQVNVTSAPPQDAVSIKVGTITGVVNANVCLDVTADKFTNIIGSVVKFGWNANHLEFVKTDAYDLEGLNSSSFSNTASTLTFQWLAPNSVPITKATNHKLFQICFKIKECLDPIPVTITEVPDIVGQGNIQLTALRVNGSVKCTTVVEVCTATCTLGAITAVSCPGGNNGAVNLSVTGTNLANHTCVWKNASGTIVKPAAAVTSGTNLTGVPAGVYTYEVLFNAMVCCTGTATVTQPTPIVIPSANAVTNVICNDKGAINISTTSGGNGGFTYLWSSTLGTTANPTNVNAGTYTVTVTDSKSCTATASFTVTNQPTVLTIPTTNTITNVICTAKGAINITGTTGGTGTLSYAWTSSLGNTANPTNLDAGTYTVTVTDTKGCSATGTYTITSQASAIVIPSTGVVTNGSCSAKGAININNVTGGNGALTYNWSPSQGNTGNPTNLNAGTYAVTVTDSKGCSASASFTVTSTQTELVVTSSITNVKCRGGLDGSVQINVSGGCPNYTYAWTGGLTGANPQGVKAGVYTVTVTDGATPASTKTLSVTITEPSGAVDISVSAITEASTSTAADGKISLTITGGSPNYRTIWSGPTSIADGNTSGSIDANNLRAGSYNVTVTDINGCSAARSNIVIGIKSPVEIAPKFGSAAVSSSFNGFGIKCFGENNGAIAARFSEGSYPVTVVLKSGSQTIRSTTASAPDISFTGLVAGSYTIEATNSKGTVTSSPIIITQPSKLAAVVNAKCSDANKEDGSIELNLNSTGAGNYGFTWFGLADLDNKIENVGAGFYNVTVTDASACELRLTNLEVEKCPVGGGDCYTGTSVMTPNGDGFNDIFLINCVTSNPSDLSIFDRWGRVVYSQINYDNSWQGLDTKGTTLKEGGYIWVLTVNFGQGRREVYKGTVTILRSN